MLEPPGAAPHSSGDGPLPCALPRSARPARLRPDAAPAAPPLPTHRVPLSAQPRRPLERSSALLRRLPFLTPTTRLSPRRCLVRMQPAMPGPALCSCLDVTPPIRRVSRCTPPRGRSCVPVPGDDRVHPFPFSNGVLLDGWVRSPDDSTPRLGPSAQTSGAAVPPAATSPGRLPIGSDGKPPGPAIVAATLPADASR